MFEFEDFLSKMVCDFINEFFDWFEMYCYEFFFVVVYVFDLYLFF